MGKGWLTLAALAFAALQSPSSAAQRFRSGVDAVRVDVLAMEGRRPLAHLTAGDFEVRDNGVVQDIQLVEATRLPLGIICAIDVSDSVGGPALDDLSRAATSLLDGLHVEDSVALLSFASRVHLVAPFTREPSRVAAAMSTLKPSGRTALRDAAFAALALRAHTSGRSLIILFSDGQDTVSWLNTADVRAAAARSDAVLYAVVSGNGEGGTQAAFLHDVTAASGGRVLVASQSIQVAFAAILEEFRTRYVISYVPREAAPGWHALAVRLTRQRGRVTARRGYFVE
jgi:VWFA-related protein